MRCPRLPKSTQRRDQVFVPSGKRIGKGAEIFESIQRRKWTNLYPNDRRKQIRPRTSEENPPQSMSVSTKPWSPRRRGNVFYRRPPITGVSRPGAGAMTFWYPVYTAYPPAANQRRFQNQLDDPRMIADAARQTRYSPRTSRKIPSQSIPSLFLPNI